MLTYLFIYLFIYLGRTAYGRNECRRTVVADCSRMCVERRSNRSFNHRISLPVCGLLR